MTDLAVRSGPWLPQPHRARLRDEPGRGLAVGGLHTVPALKRAFPVSGRL